MRKSQDTGGGNSSAKACRQDSGAESEGEQITGPPPTALRAWTSDFVKDNGGSWGVEDRERPHLVFIVSFILAQAEASWQMLDGSLEEGGG